MDTLKDFASKQRKYMPTFPKAMGKPTIYIDGYPCEDDEPMAATGFHGEQIGIFSEQLRRYFAMVLINFHSGGVFIRGQKVPSLRLFLNFFLIPQQIRIGMKRSSAVCGIWGLKSTSSINPKWRSPRSFGGGGETHQAVL